MSIHRIFQDRGMRLIFPSVHIEWLTLRPIIRQPSALIEFNISWRDIKYINTPRAASNLRSQSKLVVFEHTERCIGRANFPRYRAFSS